MMVQADSSILLYGKVKLKLTYLIPMLIYHKNLSTNIKTPRRSEPSKGCKSFKKVGRSKILSVQ